MADAGHVGVLDMLTHQRFTWDNQRDRHAGRHRW